MVRLKQCSIPVIDAWAPLLIRDWHPGLDEYAFGAVGLQDLLFNAVTHDDPSLYLFDTIVCHIIAPDGQRWIAHPEAVQQMVDRLAMLTRSVVSHNELLSRFMYVVSHVMHVVRDCPAWINQAYARLPQAPYDAPDTPDSSSLAHFRNLLERVVRWRYARMHPEAPVDASVTGMAQAVRHFPLLPELQASVLVYAIEGYVASPAENRALRGLLQ